MRKYLKILLLILTSFLFFVEVSFTILAMDSLQQPDGTIKFLVNAQEDADRLLSFLKSASHSEDKHLQSAAKAGIETYDTTVGRIKAKGESAIKSFNSAITASKIQESSNGDFIAAQQALQNSQAQIQVLTTQLEVEKAKGQEGNSEALKQLAQQILKGTAGFKDLLAMAPFLIGTPEDVMVEEGIRETREQIQLIEKQDQDFKEDQDIPILSIFLTMPALDIQADKTNHIDRLSVVVTEAKEALTAFKMAISPNKTSLKAVHRDYFPDEHSPIDPSIRPYSFLEKVLIILDQTFQAPQIDILSLCHIFDMYSQKISECFRSILGIEADPDYQQTIQLKNLQDVGEDIWKKTLQALLDLSNEINTLAEKKSTLVFSTKNIKKNVDGQQHPVMESIPVVTINITTNPTSTKENRENLNKRKSNVLLRQLEKQSPTENYKTLKKNAAYFARKGRPSNVSFPPTFIETFKRNAHTKYQLMTEKWFKTIFGKLDKFQSLSDLRITNPFDKNQNHYYCDSTKIDQIIATHILSIIDQIIAPSEEILSDDKIVQKIKEDVWKHLLIYFAEANLKEIVDEIITEKIKEKIESLKKQPLLDILRPLYQAQWAHTQFIESLQKLRSVVGNKLANLDINDGDPMTTKASDLHNTCTEFHQSMIYYQLNPSRRAFSYPLVLGVMASHMAWEELGVQEKTERENIIVSLQEARRAYFIARKAITDMASLVPSNNMVNKIWDGFETNNVLPLSLFDPNSLGQTSLAYTPSAAPPLVGGPPPPPPPPSPGSGGPVPLKKATSPLDWHVLLEKHLSEPAYKEAREAFLQEIYDNWRKLDYAPTFEGFLEICREKYNKGAPKPYDNLEAFKEFLKSTS